MDSRRVLLGVAVVFWLVGAVSVQSQTLSFTQVPEGYEAGSIELPLSFAGALAGDPFHPETIYVAVGSFGNTKLARVDLLSGSVTLAATGPFGSLGGIAVLSATQLALVENAGAAGGPPDETLLLAGDLNGDGDFDDDGEIEELIAPILSSATDSWSGSQARIAPAGNPSGIPSGSILIQTADGNGNSELLVVADPLGTPTYRPLGGAYYSGFDFNGGFDFDSQGRIFLGTAIADFTGNVLALANLNGDQIIDASEAGLVADSTGLPGGISDLAIDGDDDVFCSTGGNIDFFEAPADPFAGPVQVRPFAQTDSGFLYGMVLTSQERKFESFSGHNGAVLVVGGFTQSFESAQNLLTLSPQVSVDLNGDGRVDSKDLLLFQDQWFRSENGK